MVLEIGVVGICVVGGVTGAGETGVSEEDSSGLQLNKNAERITVTNSYVNYAVLVFKPFLFLGEFLLQLHSRVRCVFLKLESKLLQLLSIFEHHLHINL